MKKVLLHVLLLLACTCSYAAQDTITKEETTPPRPEGALTLEQIPPINSIPTASIQRNNHAHPVPALSTESPQPSDKQNTSSSFDMRQP